jgi:STE24 endopeptidase
MVQFNLLLLFFVILFFLRSGAQFLLSRLNISHLRRHGGKVPEVFNGEVDGEKIRRISAYTAESEQFERIAALVSQGAFLAVLLSGLLPLLVSKIRVWQSGLILEGLLFFAILSISATLFRIPFELYDTFVIENRYGFNVMTLKTWIFDLFKSTVISGILGGLLLWLLLSLILYGGKAWWLWAWMLVGGFELLMFWLYPVLIAPLFNKFEPVDDQELSQRIHTLVEKVGLRAKGVFKMDAGRRSRHTNAYFTGFGRSKRIVLFDTLLASHTQDEILAILAHEAGHWKKKHLLKQTALLEVVSLALFYLAARMLDWPLLYETFGFPGPIPYVGLLLIGAWLSLIGFFVQPVEAAISRRFEEEADDFAVTLLNETEAMRRALKRLAIDNLANLSPHPIYAWFYYTHPPLVERIERLTSLKK